MVMNPGWILLVEDNPDDTELTIRTLERHHLVNEIVHAEDGERALEVLLGDSTARDPGLPALVLLDLKLPRITGHEVLQTIRNDPRTRRLPVVILTNSAEETDLIRSYETGANGYVRKPVDFKQFSEVVERVGLYWLVVNEPPPPDRE